MNPLLEFFSHLGHSFKRLILIRSPDTTVAPTSSTNKTEQSRRFVHSLAYSVLGEPREGGTAA